MRIGILVTPFVSEEVWKLETIPIDNRRPWLFDVPQEYRVKVQGKDHVSDDIAIAYCLKSKVDKQGHIVDIISPLDADAHDRVKATHITFLIIYDKLEAFHTLPDSLYEKVKRILALPNVFPNKEYQKFVNHKDIYYSYFRRKGIQVLPNIYISDKEYDTNPDAAVQKIMGLEKGDDGKIIGKPILGQESIDFMEFNPPFSKERFHNYLERIFQNYEGVLFQPFIRNLRDKSEFKVMFFGDQISYVVEVNPKDGDKAMSPNQENIKDIVEFARTVFLNLPRVYFREKEVSRLITRVDIGCCYGQGGLFVSEVEFVPSLFCPDVAKDLPNKLVDMEVTQQMMKILDQVKDITPPKETNSRLIEASPSNPPNYACFDTLINVLIGFVCIYILFIVIYFIIRR